MFDEDKLTYILGYITHKFRTKYPNLINSSSVTNNRIQDKLFRILIQPFTALLSVGKIVEPFKK